MDFSYYNQYINWRSRPGVGKPDLTPLFRDKDVLRNLILDLTDPFQEHRIDAVVGPDALGFALGAAAAFRLGVGFVPARKRGRLPTMRKFVMRTSFVDYTGAANAFEINKGILPKNARLLVIDDWIDTGGQIKALVRLLEIYGAKVVGITCLAAHRFRATRTLFDRYDLHSIMPYDDVDEVRAIIQGRERDLSLIYLDE